MASITKDQQHIPLFKMAYSLDVKQLSYNLSIQKSVNSKKGSKFTTSVTAENCPSLNNQSTASSNVTAYASLVC